MYNVKIHSQFLYTYESLHFTSKDNAAQTAKDRARAVGSFLVFFSKYRGKIILLIPILGEDLSTCSTATAAGGLIRLTGCLHTRLDTYLTLPMNTKIAIVAITLDEEAVLLRTATVHKVVRPHARLTSSHASWTPLIGRSVPTLKNMLAGAKQQSCIFTLMAKDLIFGQ